MISLSIASAESLFNAWYKFRRGKRSKKDVMEYERHLEENIFNLSEELRKGLYAHNLYKEFQVYDPKSRNIHKATVKDRVVHQFIYDKLENIFESGFISDSFSCRKDKGTHAASNRLGLFLRRASKNNTRTVYALKCDIKKFFDSVDHEILLSMLEKKIDDIGILSLVRKILLSFHKSPGKGLPLGNLTSQLFANVYLHELDYFVKHNLKEKYYLRYCDDFIIVHDSYAHLLQVAEKIRKFLGDALKLEIHPNKISVNSWNRGIDFVGYVHMPHCKILRGATKRRLLKRVNSENKSSYLGLCSHADTFELQKEIRNIIGERAFQIQGYL